MFAVHIHVTNHKRQAACRRGPRWTGGWTGAV